MGIAAYPVHVSTRDQLLRAAGQALYLAKSSGCNHVAVYDQKPPEARLNI
jgi:GGDEF domain-containing protein